MLDYTKQEFFMPSPNTKKLSIIYILKILQEYSDENHLLTQNDIAQKLYSIYGMECERKSISNNIDCLIDCGFDIVKNSNGAFLAEREFEPSEITFLVDAVFSSKAIGSEYSKNLAKKLYGFLSKYERKKYNYVYKADEIIRSNNKQIFYVIDTIHQAIEKNKQIEFNYNRFYFDKQKQQKMQNKKYVVSPYFLINNRGDYYLVCNYDYFNDIANYKIELISNIKITEKPIKPITELKDCENGVDMAKYANENIYMFHNKTIDATLKIEDEYSANYIVEWFGNNASFYQKDEQVFAKIHANEQALVYWCLQYGETIELVEPLEIRQKIKQIIEKMQQKYK